jgi:hypothetical protein
MYTYIKWNLATAEKIPVSCGSVLYRIYCHAFHIVRISLFIYHSTIRRCIVWGTDSIVKQTVNK